MTAPVESTSDELPTEATSPEAMPPEAPAPTYVAPDRADAPVSEVTERFLRAVIAQVPVEQIEELHLFSPLRQGTVETGIAVIAARVPTPVEEMVDEAALELALDGEAVEVVEIEAEEIEAEEIDDATVDAELAELDGVDVEAADVDADVEVDAAIDATVDASVDVAVDATVDESVDESVDVDVDATDDVVATLDGDDDSPYAPDPIVADEAADDEVPAFGDEVVVRAPVVRHTVYTARYRYIIKGPERGKWETNVKAEADAPLVTVETVVRGVQRRAGEESEIVRFSGAQIAKALRL